MSPILLLLVPAAHAASDMSLMPDPILIAVQVVPFLVTLFALNALIYKPMLAYLDERDAATVGAAREAERLEQEAQARVHEYEARLAEARRQVADLRSEKRQEAVASRDAALGQARAEADKDIEAALKTISAEAEKAAKELEVMSTGLANEITDSILGREVTA